jgi:S1-C subfamily serine protease
MALAPESEHFVLSYIAQLERVASVLGGIPVWEVLPESEAELAGLHFGDIVLSINSKPTPTYGDFLEAGALYLARLEFNVFRNGEFLLLRAAEAAHAAKATDTADTTHA